MWLSKRDCVGIFTGAIEAKLPREFCVGYAISNNGMRLYDLKETVEIFGYQP